MASFSEMECRVLQLESMLEQALKRANESEDKLTELTTSLQRAQLQA